ncbi:Uncharacterised protein [Klebsiella pneumoniae]|nr:Uncharacterised protein [Klebsiella pneumoniae]
MGQLITSAPMRLVFWLCGVTIVKQILSKRLYPKM